MEIEIWQTTHDFSSLRQDDTRAFDANDEPQKDGTAISFSARGLHQSFTILKGEQSLCDVWVIVQNLFENITPYVNADWCNNDVIFSINASSA
jgi:hypothetical protein